jgi:hypothetical protein
MARASLLDEELNEILIMDWRLDGEMTSQKPSKAKRRTQAILNEQNRPTAPTPALTEELVKGIPSTEVPRPRVDLIAAAPRAVDWWNRPLVSAIIGGLVVLAIGGIVGGIWVHASRDSATLIADEITRQLDQRAGKDADNLSNRISAEVGKQLGPIHQQLEGLNQDIGKIKDNLHIALAHPPRSLSLQAFVGMDPKAFAASLPQLRKELEQASPQSVPRPDETLVRAVAQKLGQANSGASEYWPTVGAMITYTSQLRTKSGINPSTIHLRHCSEVSGPMSRMTFDGSTDGKAFSCDLTLDNADLSDSTISNAVVRFSGGPSKLSNVRFVNCLFLVTLPQSPITPARTIAKELLAGVGSDVTISAE